MISQIMCYPANEIRLLVTGQYLSENNKTLKVIDIDQVYIATKNLKRAWPLTMRRLKNLEILD